MGTLLAGPGQDPSSVSPGIWGFIAFFGLAIALWLLVRNMNTHLRKVSYRARQEAEERSAEQAGPAAQSPSATQGDTASAEGAGGPEAGPNGPAGRG